MHVRGVRGASAHVRGGGHILYVHVCCGAGGGCVFKLLCACGNGGGRREDGGERRAEEAVWWGENTPIAPGWPGELHTYTYRERAHTRTAHTYRTCPQHPAVHRPSPPPPAGQRGAPRLPAQPGEAGLQVPAAHQGHRRRHLRQQHQVGAGRGRAPLSAALVEKEGRSCAVTRAGLLLPLLHWPPWGCTACAVAH